MTPLLGIGVCVSIQFAALEYAKRLFAVQNQIQGRGGEGGRSLTGQQLFVSGVFAGLSNGVVSGPVEHIRIRRSFYFLKVKTRLTVPSRSPDPIKYKPNIQGSMGRNQENLFRSWDRRSVQGPGRHPMA